jgi:tetratricopeptide (TPR) repeat protein
MSNTGTFKALGDLPDDIIENFKNKEYNICKEKCTGILASNPNNGFAFIYLGKIAESEKDFETAIAHYKRVTEIEPRFPFIWSYIGENYTELERYKEAYEAFTEEIALMPSKAEIKRLLFIPNNQILCRWKWKIIATPNDLVARYPAKFGEIFARWNSRVPRFFCVHLANWIIRYPNPIRRIANG